MPIIFWKKKKDKKTTANFSYANFVQRMLMIKIDGLNVTLTFLRNMTDWQ